MLDNLSVAVFVLKLAFAGFFSALFLQSGIDKLINFRENLEWLQSHFSKTFFSRIVPFLLAFLTLLEVTTGSLSLFGFFDILINDGSSKPAFYGSILSLVCFICLFTTQRIAKDYQGAVSIASYFTVAALSVIIQSV